MNTYKLTLCYDGTRYKGWQRQENTANTIQNKLENIISEIIGERIELSASGRTDAGVHAREQICSFHTEKELLIGNVIKCLRKYLPEDIGIINLERAPEKFHARLSCREKTYLYRVWIAESPNVFEKNYIYRYPGTFNIEKMKAAEKYLCGEHDFTAFTSNKHMKKSAVRNLKKIEITETESELQFTLTGDGFLYNMVRIIVGTLLEIGEGRREPEEIPKILNSKIRENAGFTAPAKGLILWEVKY